MSYKGSKTWAQLRGISLLQRFAAKLRLPADLSQCWEWTARTRNPRSGHCYISNAGRMLLAHRVAWELFIGPVPAGLCVLHRCDNPPCMNPAHLFLGTVQDNNRDSLLKGRQGNRLSAEDVLAIRSRPDENRDRIAADYGVKRKAIERILTRRTWGWL